MLNSSGRPAPDAAGAGADALGCAGVGVAMRVARVLGAWAVGAGAEDATCEEAGGDGRGAGEEAAGVCAAADVAGREDAGAAEELDAALLTAGAALDTGAEEPESELPEPTAVVSSPLSTYTPLKNQSSAPAASLLPGSLRTPRCQSAPLDDVLALTGPAVLLSAAPPVDIRVGSGISV